MVSEWMPDEHWAHGKEFSSETAARREGFVPTHPVHASMKLQQPMVGPLNGQVQNTLTPAPAQGVCVGGGGLFADACQDPGDSVPSLSCFCLPWRQGSDLHLNTKGGFSIPLR